MANICDIHKDTLGKAIKDFTDFSAETFDLTGKSNPQYRRYENWGKFLKNKYGGKLVTDPQGNTWIEIALKKELGKMPIEAFGMLPLIPAFPSPIKKKDERK